jgi:hypothetical protein
MRTYGRVYNEDGTYQWVEVSTDADGHDDYVWLTTLIQTLKLNLGESPFYGDYGIPAQQALIQQIFPDFYVYRTQAQFAPHFASLLVSKRNSPTPTYDINVTTNQGVKMAISVPV